MSLTKYERGNTIKITAAFKSDDILTDPSGNKVWFHVIRSDGEYLYSAQQATRTGTGTYQYYISTNASDPLGIYIVHWYAYHTVGGSQPHLPLVQRDVFQLVDTEH